MKTVLPPIPKKEKPAVTIANQAIQIDNLLHRVEELSNGRNEAIRQRLEFEKTAKEAQWNFHTEQSFRRTDNERLNEAQALIAKLESQIEGYRMAIKDICGS